MSLCIAQKGINGNLFVGADSRVSAYAADGSIIRTGENIDKIRVLPDGSLVFISGFRDALECIINDFCKNIGQGCKGIKDAQRLASLMQLHAEQITAK